MAFAGDNPDGVGVVGVCWFGLQGCNELAEVFADMFAVCDACDVELHKVADVLILWPDGDVVPFVFYAEVTETSDGHVFVRSADGDSDSRTWFVDSFGGWLFCCADYAIYDGTDGKNDS